MYFWQLSSVTDSIATWPICVFIDLGCRLAGLNSINLFSYGSRHWKPQIKSWFQLLVRCLSFWTWPFLCRERERTILSRLWSLFIMTLVLWDQGPPLETHLILSNPHYFRRGPISKHSYFRGSGFSVRTEERGTNFRSVTPGLFISTFLGPWHLHCPDVTGDRFVSPEIKGYVGIAGYVISW